MKAAGHGFGTFPVFLAGISTILGAVMFLRFGYAVGEVGLLGTLVIILLGHMVTIPTALAISEIATNLKVEGGGEYFIISRSFGLRIGSAIGIALFLSQAISVAFYCIAFAEAFTPLADVFLAYTGVVFDTRFVSIPITVLLTILMLTRGASMGVKTLYAVVVILAISLALFFLGHPLEPADGSTDWLRRSEVSQPFFVIFAICFPAFTGMTAGVGLSGDLAKPSRSIPLGTLSATLVGMLIYMAIVWQLQRCAMPEDLVNDQLIMSKIALGGVYVIPFGLACATLSSAIGSVLVAPRTLQALAKDGSLLLPWVNNALAKGRGESNEPRNATLLTAVIAITVVAMGSVDMVASLISMFFMVTYGALCTISFLEHFAARPSYRPSFRSRWYLSLLGAVMCFFMMVAMDPFFAVAALASMFALYYATRWMAQDDGSNDLAVIFRGVLTQALRKVHIRLQRSEKKRHTNDWRPSILAVRSSTFTGNTAALKLLGWLGRRYGVSTYLHYIEGLLDAQTFGQSEEAKKRLIDLCKGLAPDVYADTVVSPSMRSALAQALQIPGISGTQNNTVLFDLPSTAETKSFEELAKQAEFVSVAEKNILTLRYSDKEFGRRKSIHLWLTWNDQRNGPLMVLLAYMLLGEKDWKGAEISAFAAFPKDKVEIERQRFEAMVSEGRLPISRHNVRFLSTDGGEEFNRMVEHSSSDADLVFLGLSARRLASKGADLLARHPKLRNVLFVTAAERIAID